MDDIVIWILVIMIGVSLGICIGFWIGGLHNGIHKRQLDFNKNVEEYMKMNTEILDNIVSKLKVK